MANQVLFSSLNSIPLYWTDRSFPSGKNQYFIDEDWYINQIQPWNAKSFYAQKYQLSDSIYIQLQSNIAPHAWQIIDCKNNVLKSGSLTQVTTLPLPTPLNYYETKFQLADVEEGQIFIKITSGAGANLITHISEPIDLALDHEETILIKYKGAGDDLNVWFDGTQEFQLRVEGRVNQYVAGNVSKTYQDQILNTVELSSVPFDQYKLTVGGSYGIPDWLLKKVNAAFSYSSVIIENLQFVRMDGGKFDVTRADRYNLVGASMDILPADNLNYVLADTDFNRKIITVYNIDSRVFGTFNDQPGNNIIQITDIE